MGLNDHIAPTLPSRRSLCAKPAYELVAYEARDTAGDDGASAWANRQQARVVPVQVLRAGVLCIGSNWYAALLRRTLSTAISVMAISRRRCVACRTEIQGCVVAGARVRRALLHLHPVRSRAANYLPPRQFFQAVI